MTQCIAHIIAHALHLISVLLDVVIVVVVHRRAVHVQVAVVPRLLHVDQQLPPGEQIINIVDDYYYITPRH